MSYLLVMTKFFELDKRDPDSRGFAEEIVSFNASILNYYRNGGLSKHQVIRILCTLIQANWQFSSIETALSVLSGSDLDIIVQYSDSLRLTTPLALAFTCNKLSIMEKMLEKGAKLDMSLPDGTQPQNLFLEKLATITGIGPILRSRLVDYQISLLNNMGINANTVNQLKQGNHKQSELHKAVREGNLIKVRALLALGANINQYTKGCRPKTSLIIAAEAGKTEMVRLLLENNADPLLTVYSKENPNPETAYDLIKDKPYERFGTIQGLLQKAMPHKPQPITLISDAPPPQEPQAKEQIEAPANPAMTNTEFSRKLSAYILKLRNRQKDAQSITQLPIQPNVGSIRPLEDQEAYLPPAKRSITGPYRFFPDNETFINEKTLVLRAENEDNDSIDRVDLEGFFDVN